MGLQEIKNGDRIKHTVYGEGTVQAVWHNGTELVARVLWDQDVDRRKLDRRKDQNPAFTVVLSEPTVTVADAS